MNGRSIEFLVDRSGSAPRNLSDSIRQVQNCSSGFRRIWPQGLLQEALETSQDAFEHLDHIQNEILRQRDSHSKQPGWAASPFNTALNAHVGRIVHGVSVAEQSWFASLSEGGGVLPSGSTPALLSLATALNKLKHRSTSIFNFSLPSSGGHFLYVFATAGMGQPDSISEIDVDEFCSACRTAASHT
jgi:hypothetical protein